MFHVDLPIGLDKHAASELSPNYC